MKLFLFLLVISFSFSKSFCQSKTPGNYNKKDAFGNHQGYWIYSIPLEGGHRWGTLEGIYYKGIEIGVWCLKNWKGELIQERIYFDTLKHKVQVIEYFNNGGVKKSEGYKYQIAHKDTIYAYNEVTDSLDIPIYTDSILAKQNKWIYYHINGEIESIGLYKNDKKTGIWKYYNEKGELTKTEEY